MERAHGLAERSSTTGALREPAVEGFRASIFVFHADQIVRWRVSRLPAELGLAFGMGTGWTLVGVYDTLTEGFKASISVTHVDQIVRRRETHLPAELGFAVGMGMVNKKKIKNRGRETLPNAHCRLTAH